ncbi:glutathione S-transferase Mu 1-like [Corapipo altera]|uniref:glutathione S-transferase Mu 1-like n=1 Tax=Corapipo altera TaxID=415028 RepID=UPI000FD681DC|nr:glutathione S-transferase Mu 1-like [Corapipo altera]
MAVLGYWDIRGLAHAIRLLLEYTETPYEDKLYSCGEAPDYDKSQWINEKEKLGLDFPNLPYFIDGPVRLTQSNAILRHIARRHRLCQCRGEWGWIGAGVGLGLGLGLDWGWNWIGLHFGLELGLWLE